MKNPLLVPELRDMLASASVAEIRDFCASTSPEVAAEFVGALSIAEQQQLFGMLETDSRSLLFASLDPESQLPVLDGLPRDEAVALVAGMPDEPRAAFFERLPPEHHVKLRDALATVPKEEAQPLLEELADASAADKQAPEELTAEEVASEISEHIEAFRLVAGKVERLPRIERGCWVNVVNPTKDNLPLLARHFRIPVDFLTASLDLDETARIEIDDNATLFIVKVPYFDESNIDVLYFTIPVGIILTNGLILTVCAKPGGVLGDLIENRVRHLSGDPQRFILQLVMRATMVYLQHLKQLNNAANVIQKKLEQESRNRQLIKLFNIEKSLVYFTTSLRSNQLMLERLRRLRSFPLDEAGEDLLEDIFTECRQAIEMANIYSDILSGMMDAFASVISNNLNIVMRMLTSLTIIITIPVLVASFYGMNVKLPLQEHPYAFLFVIGLSVLLGAGAIFYFWRKRWLER